MSLLSHSSFTEYDTVLRQH